jgi:hypothetical protein
LRLLRLSRDRRTIPDTRGEAAPTGVASLRHGGSASVAPEPRSIP